MKKIYSIFLIALFWYAPAHAVYKSSSNAQSVPASNSFPVTLGVSSLFDYDPLFITKTETQQAQSMQNWLLYAQRLAIAQGAASYASNHIPACITAIPFTGEFGQLLNNTIVIPRYVCFDPSFVSFIRDGLSGSASANWTGDPTAVNLANYEQPMFIFPPMTNFPNTLIANLNRNNTDRGSGVSYGRTWRIKTLTIASGGSGFVGGETCIVANGDQYPAAGAFFTVATVSGSAAATLTYSPARWSTQTGQYYLPPFQQAYQWTAANGWNGGDTYHPQVFDGSGHYLTTCNGAGVNLTVTPTWWADWEAGSTAYDGMFSNLAASTGYIHNLYLEQSGNVNDGTYGPTFGLMISSYDLDIDNIQTSFARYGMIADGIDLRIKMLNDVGSWVCEKFAAGGSVEVNEAVLDTPIDHYLEIDKETGFRIKGKLLNNGTNNPTGAASILIGADTNYSSSSTENTEIGLDFSGSNAGNGTGIPFLSCANTRNSIFTLNAANLDTTGSPSAYQNTSLINFGSHCETSNSFEGQIDNVSGSIFTGTVPNVGLHIWDAAAGGYAGSLTVTPSVPAISTSTFAINSALSNTFRIVLVHAACPCTISNPTSVADGKKITLEIVQSATGSDTIGTWGTNFDFGTAGAPTLTTGANKIDILGFQYSTNNSKWNYLGVQQGM